MYCFEDAELELIRFGAADILTTSGGFGDAGMQDEDTEDPEPDLA